MVIPRGLVVMLLLASLPVLRAADPENLFSQRRDAVLAQIQAKPWPSPEKNIDAAPWLALLMLFKNDNVAEANRLVLAYCGADPMTTYVGRPVPKNRCEAIFRVCLLDRTRERLTKEAREAIEDHAWMVLTQYPLGMSRKKVDEAELAHYLLPNNGQANLWRRYTLALEIAKKSQRHGPQAMLEGETIESHVKAWNRFWITFFKTFPNEGTDVDIAHPTSYGACTGGAFHDIHDLVEDAEVRKLAGNFLTLFWAEVAAEFNPRNGERVGMATTRWPTYTGKYTFWARRLLYCYGWHDEDDKTDGFLGAVTLLTTSYRPPAIVTAIARDTNRGSYLATSRRPGMTGCEGIEITETAYRDGIMNARIIFDESGGSGFRRDVYYTPDYALGTLASDPRRSYINDITLTPMMGVTFAADKEDRITVLGTGYYCERATSGITDTAVSIIARDPNAKFGRGRFMSDGTRVFISNGPLWDNRIEDPSGWFFTYSGDAYAAIRVADGGYQISTKTFTWPDRTLKEIEERNGHHLELGNMWAPIVIQMGRASDYESFEAFCTAVKDNRFEYADDTLAYTSEAGETFELWAKGTHLPTINGETINLNPPKTFDSPFLSMEHGSSKAIIRYPGYDDVVLEF